MSVSACITSVSGPVLLPDERAFLRDAQPWGVILMGRSCETKDQVRSLVESIQDGLGREALIFIDQEGGRVARLKPPEWPKFPPAGQYGALYDIAPDLGIEACRVGHQLLAGELHDLGIHADCAPVGDLRQTDTHDAIGDRSFGFSAEAVSDLAGAALDGLSRGGVAGVIKHMPGQGRATADSHYDLPEVTASKSELALDFSIFSVLSENSLMGMTGHVAFKSLDPANAATVSETVISEIIRGRIGFDGLLMTDDLGMNALGGDLADRGARALAAGCDVLLHCSGFLRDPDDILSEMEAVAGAAGAMSVEASARAARVMNGLQAPEPFDSEAGWSRLSSLLSHVAAGA